MGTEIERKFLLTSSASEVLEAEGVAFRSREYIYQTYLAFTDDQEVRIRKKIDHLGRTSYMHTFKSGQGIAREEVEYAISGEVYEQLLQRTGLVPLEKVRTTVESGGRSYEIDEYKQVDLAVVEAEFASMDEASAFAAPPWFGRELGAEEEYRNKTLWMKLQTS
jgi:CYTH domain-containing protein